MARITSMARSTSMAQGTCHVFLQSQNVLELGGMTTKFWDGDPKIYTGLITKCDKNHITCLILNMQF